MTDLTAPGTVERARQGDRDAYRTLVETHGRSLFRVAFRMTGNRHDAEDVVQEALFRAYRRIDEYSDDGHFVAAAHRIVSNLSIDLLRRRKRWRSDDIDDREHVAPLRASDAGPERLLASDEIQVRVSSALDQLTPKERIAFTLRHYEGLPMKEIAEITGVNLNSTKNYVFRAVKKLRTALAPLREVRS